MGSASPSGWVGWGLRAQARVRRALDRLVAWWRDGARATLDTMEAAIALPDPKPIDLRVSEQERFAQFFTTLGLEALQREDLEEQRRQDRIAEILAEKRAREAAPPVSDAALKDIAQVVIDMTEYSIMMTRTDIAIASTHPDDAGQLKKLSNGILRRTNHLLLLRKARPIALALHPRLATWWTEDVDRRTEIVTRHFVSIAAAVLVGDVSRPSEEEAQREMLRLLPGAFGSSRLTPEDVVDFCMRHRIASRVAQAVRIARAAFPKAHSLRLELDGDPEGNEEWVLMQIDTPDDVPEYRFDKYLEGLLRVMPADDARRFELFYNVAA